MRRTLQGTAALAERWMLARGTAAALVGKGSGHRAVLGNKQDWWLRANATSGTSIVPPSWTAGPMGARGASTAADAMLREEAPADSPLPRELPTVYQQFIHKSRCAASHPAGLLVLQRGRVARITVATRGLRGCASPP
jgi:hypothetical protein